MEIADAIRSGLEISGRLEGEPRLRRRREIGRAAYDPGIMRRDGVQHLGGCVAAGDTSGIGRKTGQIRVPSVGRLALPHPLELAREVRVFLPICDDPRQPAFPKLSTTLPDAGTEILDYAVRHEEHGIFGPA